MLSAFTHVLSLDDDPAVRRILRGFYVASPPPPLPAKVLRMDEVRRVRSAR